MFYVRYRLLGWGGAALFSLVLFSGCAYRLDRSNFVPADESLKSERYRIFIPVVDNTSSRSGPEAILTSALRVALADIPNVEVVNDIEDSDFLLLAKITNFNTRMGAPRTGDESSAARGGLASLQRTASELISKISMEVSLLPKASIQKDLDKTHVKIRSSPLWTKLFEREVAYSTSDRDSEKGGSSSAVYINESRERIHLNLLCEGLAQNVVDQMVLGF